MSAATPIVTDANNGDGRSKTLGVVWVPITLSIILAIANGVGWIFNYAHMLSQDSKADIERTQGKRRETAAAIESQFALLDDIHNELEITRGLRDDLSTHIGNGFLQKYTELRGKDPKSEEDRSFISSGVTALIQGNAKVIRDLDAYDRLCPPSNFQAFNWGLFPQECVFRKYANVYEAHWNAIRTLTDAPNVAPWLEPFPPGFQKAIDQQLSATMAELQTYKDILPRSDGDAERSATEPTH